MTLCKVHTQTMHEVDNQIMKRKHKATRHDNMTMFWRSMSTTTTCCKQQSVDQQYNWQSKTSYSQGENEAQE